MPQHLQQIKPESNVVLFPWWLSAIVIVGSLLMAMGAIIAVVRPAMLVPPGEQINAAVRVYAGYLFSRNLAIAVVLLGALALRARPALVNLSLLTALIQLLDAGIDCVEGRWTLVPGVLVLAIFFYIAANHASGHSLWSFRDRGTEPRP